jgi:dynein heavy chain
VLPMRIQTVQYSENLHERAKTELDRLTEYIRSTGGKLHRKIDDLDSLRFMINILKEVRDKESSMEMEINPIMDMYQLLEYYLPPGFMEKEEIDKKTILRSSWKKVVALSLSRADELSRAQSLFRSDLLKDIEALKIDVAQVRIF